MKNIKIKKINKKIKKKKKIKINIFRIFKEMVKFRSQKYIEINTQKKFLRNHNINTKIKELK